MSGIEGAAQVMTKGIWQIESDDGSGVLSHDDIFFDDESGSGQVEYTDDDDADLLAVDSAQEETRNFEEIVNLQSSVSESAEAESTNRERKSMSEFDDAIAKAVSNIPECLAGGVVDLESGMLLGVKTVDSHPQEVLDMLAAATQDLFQGQNVVTIENTFKKARGLEMDDYHYFKEIIVNSENLIHVFIRGKQHSQYVMTFVCRLSANLGMVLTKARAQVPVLEAAI